MTGPPAIDLAVLDALTEQLGDSGMEMRRALLATYLQEGAERMAELRAAVDRDDAATVQDVAHTLKSSSAQLGVMPLVDLLQQTEDAARVGALGVTSLAALAEAEYARAAIAIGAQLGTTPDSDRRDP